VSDPEVVVVGSINHDLTIVAERQARPGETVLGIEHFSSPGGKGANQSVAVARLQGKVAMIGRVGDDDQGQKLLDVLKMEGVDVSGVVTDRHAATGLAVITLDTQGENSIVVSPGANRNVDVTQIRTHAPAIGSATVVLAQLEIPLETVSEVAAITSGTFVLNPAPAHTLPEDLLARVNVLLPNRGELAIVAGDDEPGDADDAIDLARTVEGPGAVVVTLGQEGAVVIEGAEATHIPAPDVDAIDATGAGDAFCGALAQALTLGIPLVEAARWGVTAGAIATTRRGAQTALPTLRELKEFL
jgi:ribokinase